MRLEVALQKRVTVDLTRAVEVMIGDGGLALMVLKEFPISSSPSYRDPGERVTNR